MKPNAKGLANVMRPKGTRAWLRARRFAALKRMIRAPICNPNGQDRGTCKVIIPDDDGPG